jgi:hypothetical protein
MRQLVVALVALVVLTMALSVGAQDNDLSIGSVALTLGMKESTVRERLSSYELDAVPDSSSILVCKHSAAIKHCLGQIAFKDGRLTFIGRDWPIDPKRPLTAVVGALTSLGKSCPKSSTITPDQTQGPELLLNTVTIQCGNRRVDIISTDDRAQPSVDEQIGTIFVTEKSP